MATLLHTLPQIPKRTQLIMKESRHEFSLIMHTPKWMENGVHIETYRIIYRILFHSCLGTGFMTLLTTTFNATTCNKGRENENITLFCLPVHHIRSTCVELIKSKNQSLFINKYVFFSISDLNPMNDSS